MGDLNEAAKAWMAGFVDGEGCLTISRQVRPGRPSPAYRAFIQVTNTNRPSVEIFRAAYGGTVRSAHETRCDERKVAWAEAFVWYCPRGSAYQLLNDILPHLRVKHEQAEILLTFLATKNGFARGTRVPGARGGSAPLTPEEIEHREGLRKRIQLLNTKGPRARKELVRECDAAL